MFDSARDRINRARLFAQRHHTLVACTATGIITWKVTRSSTFKEVSDYVYAIEMQNEHLLLQNRVMLDFINERNLGEELQNHILSMKQ